MTTRTTRRLPWLAPLIIAATLAAYGAWWAVVDHFDALEANTIARRFGYQQENTLNGFTSCWGVIVTCQRGGVFTTTASFEEFRALVAQQQFKNFANGEPAQPMRKQGEWLYSILDAQGRARVTDSSGRNDGAMPSSWWWMVRDEQGRIIVIYFYETAGKGYRLDGNPIGGNVVVLTLGK